MVVADSRACGAVKSSSVVQEPAFSLEHLGLAARDPAALKDWYTRVLGAVVVFASDTVPPAFFVRLPGGVLLEIYAGERGVTDTGNNRVFGWRHVALRVGSIEAARDRLSQHGVLIEDQIKPAGGGGRVLFFADAEGNLLHLVERPPGSPFAG